MKLLITSSACLKNDLFSSFAQAMHSRQSWTYVAKEVNFKLVPQWNSTLNANSEHKNFGINSAILLQMIINWAFKQNYQSLTQPF